MKPGSAPRAVDAVVVLCWLGLAGAAGAQEQSKLPETFEFERLNRTYEALVDELAPIELGVARIELVSPEHALTIRRHRATLTPTRDGEHLASLDLEFEGRGRIEADITIGSIQSQLEDELVVPAQTVTLEGRISLDRTAGGYSITTRELGPEVEVAIESRLATQLFSLCHQLVLVLVTMDCGALERALSSVRVPLPPVGESYFLSDDELSEDDRRRLDAYLTRATLQP